MRLITAGEQRALDRMAAEAQLPTRALMESAGAAVARAVLAGPCARVAVFCGPGNNGGDGYVAARLLREVKLCPPEQPGDAGERHGAHGDLARRLAGEPIVCIATISRERLKGDALAAAIAWDACGGCTLSLDELE